MDLLKFTKSDIAYAFSLKCARVKVGWYDSLPIEKSLALYVIILIKSVLNKDQNQCYYNILLEKWSYPLTKK